MSEALQV